MKLLYIYRYCILGGVTAQLVNRLRGLSNICELHFLFLFDYGGKVAFEHYPNIYIGNAANILEELIDDYQYDVISVIDTPEVYPWLKEINYAGKIIHEVHTTTSNISQLTQLVRSCPMDLIVTPSAYMKKVIEEIYKFKDKVPVKVIHNCLDETLFQYVPSRQESGKRTILWVGKLDEHKRWKDFVEICKKLQYKYKVPNLEYIVVGGETAPEQVINQFIRSIVENQLEEHVKWYSSINYREMNRLYSKVYDTRGVYVSTTVNESFGMTVIEANMLGVPVVVPKVGALEEMCRHVAKDTLYTQGELEEACRLIVRQLQHPVLLGKHYYTCEHTAQQLREILKQLLEGAEAYESILGETI